MDFLISPITLWDIAPPVDFLISSIYVKLYSTCNWIQNRLTHVSCSEGRTVLFRDRKLKNNVTLLLGAISLLLLSACGAEGSNSSGSNVTPSFSPTVAATVATPTVNIPTGGLLFPVPTPVIVGPPGWFKDVPAYPNLQKLEMDEATIASLGLSRADYYFAYHLSHDSVPGIAEFYTAKLSAAGWQVVQRLPLSKESVGQQITFNRRQNQVVQVLTLLTANSEALAAAPNTKALAPKIPPAQNLVMLIVSADVQPLKIVTPETSNLPKGVAAENLSFDFGDGWVAQGQLTYPAGQSGPFPTVILVHGSGPQDMDGTLDEATAGLPGGSKILRQLAYYLPTRGFAVVRYNRRGVIGLGPQLSGDPKLSVTHSKLTQDAGFVLDQTRKNQRVDPQRLIMLGHSEGSLNVSSLVTTPAGSTAAGVILLGVQGYDIKATLQYQLVERTVQYAHAADSDKDDKLSLEEFSSAVQPGAPVSNVGLLEAVVPGSLQNKFKSTIDRNGDNQLDIESELRPWLQSAMNGFPNLNIPGYGPGAAAFLQDWQQSGSVTQILPAYQKPILLLNGEGDTQTIVQGAQEVNRALDKANHPDHKLITYPGLGHTFYPVKGFIQPLGPMQDKVLEDIADWLSQRYLKK